MNLGKDTARKMLSNIDMQLKALATEQQSMNNNKGGGPMSKGGRVRMQDRGNVPWNDYANILDPINYLKDRGNSKAYPFNLPDVNVVGNNPVAIKPNNLARIYGSMNFDSAKYMIPEDTWQPTNTTPFVAPGMQFSNPLDNPISSSFNPTVSKEQTLKSAGIGDNKFGLNKWMGLIGPAFNAIAGATVRRPGRLNPNDFQNPYESQSLAMMPTEFNIEPQKNEIRNQYANYIKNTNNVSNSRSERQGNYVVGLNRTNEAYGNLYTQKFNEENRLRTMKASAMGEFGARRAATNLQVSEMDLANQAQARNMRRQYLAAATEGVGNWSNVNKQMANQKASQDQWVKALLRQVPWMSQWLGMENYKYGG